MDNLTGYVILMLSIVILVIFLYIIFSKKYDKYKRGVVFSKFIFLYLLILVILADIYAIIIYGIHNFQRFFLGELQGSFWGDGVPPYMAHVAVLVFFIGYLISIWLNNKMIKIEEEHKKLDKERKEYYKRHIKK